MTQVTARLMTSDRSARRYDRVVQWRCVYIMQTVAMMMSDIGSSDREPSSGDTANPECGDQQPGDHQQQQAEGQHQQVPEPPDRRHQVVAALGAVRWLSGERSHGIRLRQCSRRICIAPKHQRCRWVSIPAQLGGTTPRPKQRGM